MGSKLKYYLIRILRSIVRRVYITRSETQQFYTKDLFKGHKYVIGEYTYGKPKVLFDNGSENLVIGKYCSIAEEVTILLGGNHSTSWLTTYPFNKLYNSVYQEFAPHQEFPSSKGSVEIGHDVWIGYRTLILSGVKIGNGAIIAAGSVITKEIGPYEIWGGNPARLIRKRFSENQIKELQKIAWWDWDHQRIIQDLSILCSEDAGVFIEIKK
jgi:acetyltransferase-like isoleucine patch superfamily enzyme